MSILIFVGLLLFLTYNVMAAMGLALLFAQILTVSMCVFGLYGGYILSEREDSWLKRLIDGPTDRLVTAINTDIYKVIEDNAEAYMQKLNSRSANPNAQ